MENSPKVSVIIPSLDGYRDGNVEKLLAGLKKQTFKNIELKLVKGISPNGKARNVGAGQALGQILVFIDDDVRLGHDKVLENLISALESDSHMAMAGASIKIHEDTGYFGREYNALRNISLPVMGVLDYQGLVQHSCLAIKKTIFEEVGGESEDLITGTDVDLNMRVKAKGYKIAVVPDAWVYHLMPNSVIKLIKKAFISGLGAAYAAEVKQEVFGLPKIKFSNYTVKTKTGALIYRVIANLIRLPIFVLTFKPVHFLFYFFHTVGYIYGSIKY